MKLLSLAVVTLLLASVSPAAAQYSYSGSAGALRTAPAQNKNKVTAAPSRPVAPAAPGLQGQVNRNSPQAAEGKRTEGPPKPPTLTRTPLNSVPGQARPVQGVAR